MAEPTNIFGTNAPLPSEEYERNTRSTELMKEEWERIGDNRDRRAGSYGLGGGSGWEQADRIKEERAAQRRVQQQMAIETPEEQAGKLGDEIKRRTAGYSWGGVRPEEIEETTLKIAAEAARDLNMPGMAANMATAYADKLRGRIKSDMAASKLAAETTSAQNAAVKSGWVTDSRPDFASGNTYKYKTDLQGNPVGEPQIEKYAEFEIQNEGEGPDGKDTLVLVNKDAGAGSPNKRVEINARDDAEVRMAMKRMNDASKQFKLADKEIAKVDAVMDRVNSWTTGALGTTIADWGNLPLWNASGDARAIKSAITSIQSTLGFNALKDLREQGSTLGQIAVIELQLLQAVVADLDQAVSPEDLREKFRLVKEHYSNYIKAVQGQIQLKDLPWDNPEYAKYIHREPPSKLYPRGRRAIKDPDAGMAPRQWLDNPPKAEK